MLQESLKEMTPLHGVLCKTHPTHKGKLKKNIPSPLTEAVQINPVCPKEVLALVCRFPANRK